MRATIHRGAHEIGGSCIELESGGERLVLDLGRPLWAAHGQRVPLPNVPGLEHHDPSLRAVILTHPHLDHYGLALGLDPLIEITMGEAAHRLLTAARFFTGADVPRAPSRFLCHRRPIEIGPFTVTPFLNDHSAFDAYSVLVEAAGRRLFYTGDIRGHGRKRGAFEQLLRRPPADVHVLLLEGTNIRGPELDTHRGLSEQELELQLAELARSTPGLLLSAYSPQNIDRLVSMYRAARRAGRELVLDLYAASIAAATGRSTIPQVGWDGIRVYLPRSQRRRVVIAKAFDRVDAVRDARIYIEEIQERTGELAFTFRSSMLRELADGGCLNGAHVVWSMWPGYLEYGGGRELRDALAARGTPMSICHASGHAYVPDLQRLTRALAPERVVPIHSGSSGRYGELFERVDPQKDGWSWAI